MPTPDIIQSNLYPEAITISVPPETERFAEVSEFVFGSPEMRPSTSERTNIEERFAWAGGCLTRFALYSYAGELTETRRRFEDALELAPSFAPTLARVGTLKALDLSAATYRRAAAREEDTDMQRIQSSFMIEAGQVLHMLGRKLEAFKHARGTAHINPVSLEDADSFDQFTRHRLDAEPGQPAAQATTTFRTSRSSDIHPHFIAETALSGRGKDVQASFSYSSESNGGSETPPYLTVSGSLAYGESDFRYQNTTFASLVVAGNKFLRMTMEL